MWRVICDSGHTESVYDLPFYVNENRFEAVSRTPDSHPRLDVLSGEEGEGVDLGEKGRRTQLTACPGAPAPIDRRAVGHGLVLRR